MLTIGYHNVLRESAAGVPIAKYQITVDTLRRHLRHFRRQLLHPLEVHEALERGKTPKGVLITFDDGGAGVVEASRVLAEIGKVGVAFVCPGSVEQGGLWFYKVANAVVYSRRQHLRWRHLAVDLASEEEKRAAYRALSNFLFDVSTAEREDMLGDLVTALEPTGEIHPAFVTASKADLAQAAAAGGMIFANHSWSHPNLTRLSEAEQAHEIDAARAWLAASQLPTVPWFAFPRGVYSPPLENLVSQRYQVMFASKPNVDGRRVRPRILLNELDARPWRFWLKISHNGLLTRYKFW